LVTTKVKPKLFDDNIVRGASISVDTFEGNVTLTNRTVNITNSIIAIILTYGTKIPDIPGNPKDRKIGGNET